MKTFIKLSTLAILMTLPLMVSAAPLQKTLKQGAENDDVKILQALLAADPSIYPQATVSGYFGALTREAVKKFQKKYNLPQTGFVGVLTLAQLNEALKATPVEVKKISVASSPYSTTTVSVVCQRIPPGHLIAPGWIKKNGKVQVIPECQTLPPGISEKLTGGSGGGGGSTTTPPVPDTTAPVISSLTYSATTDTISIFWVTDEYATTQAYYGTGTPISLATSTMKKVDSMSLVHGVTLTGLLPGTQYYFIAVSVDNKGNVASSTQIAIKTTVASDTTAPVFTWILPYPFSNVATVMWITNELATGKIFYGTSTPLTASTSMVMQAPNPAMNQSVSLTGLTASTTYYFAIEAKDIAGNAATSSVQSFTTQ